MNTLELLNKIKETDRALNFQLPNGDFIKGDLHITEVKNVHVDSTDCGGYKHSFKETIIQLWLNENSSKTEYWTTSKATKIFDLVGQQRDYLIEAEAFIEFGDSSHITSKYAVEFEEKDDQLTAKLKYVFPQCKPRSLFKNACC